MASQRMEKEVRVGDDQNFSSSPMPHNTDLEDGRQVRQHPAEKVRPLRSCFPHHGPERFGAPDEVAEKELLLFDDIKCALLDEESTTFRNLARFQRDPRMVALTQEWGEEFPERCGTTLLDAQHVPAQVPQLAADLRLSVGEVEPARGAIRVQLPHRRLGLRMGRSQGVEAHHTYCRAAAAGGEGLEAPAGPPLRQLLDEPDAGGRPGLPARFAGICPEHQCLSNGHVWHPENTTFT
mmetsp:Transcript_123617/g.350059  ORF Transcript_123617/g.350059 Transcript_123617/m.350059 type:complete len:237 (+) Transcript_123617:711-1421(+)